MNEKVLDSRNVAIVGPYLSGKTTLLESMLFVTGAVTRKGKVVDQNTVGDSTPEARDRQMSIEINAANAEYGGVRFTLLDCPGSVEFAQESLNALMGVDAVVIVCEPVSDRVLTLAPLFKFLDDWQIPHLVFINKMDRADVDFNEVLQALKKVSSRPLVAHQYPIGIGDKLVGFIDLVSEQAYHYHPGAPADPVPLPESLRAQEKAARNEMLETLANFDDHLLEELLEEIEPPQEEIVQDLKLELGADQIVPVFIGVADRDFGVRPLLQALFRESPEPDVMAKRRGISLEGSAIAQVLKTYHTAQGGKLSLVRLWRGTIQDGMTLNGVRVGGLYRLMGLQQQPVNVAHAGDIVALGRLEGIKTGDTLTEGSLKDDQELPRAGHLAPVFALAIVAEKRSDEVKLTVALSKLLDEDPSLIWEQHGDTHEIILWGQGDIHLQVAMARLSRKYNLPMTSHPPQVPYKETIRKPAIAIHGRYKRQTGGHGQFGDVYLDIQPLSRGTGFNFSEKIVGGVIPRQYIPAVEHGVREYLVHGPLGFPVVDLAVTLTNGSYHSVDSSEQAFKQAARIAMQEGLLKCQPILLEPILNVVISVPTEFTSRVLRLVNGRRGHILGYDAKTEWAGWDEVVTHLPQAEMHDLIVELRSLTMGVGFFNWTYDHLQEVPEKLAERLLVTTATDHSNGHHHHK